MLGFSIIKTRRIKWLQNSSYVWKNIYKLVFRLAEIIEYNYPVQWQVQPVKSTTLISISKHIRFRNTYNNFLAKYFVIILSFLAFLLKYNKVQQRTN